MSPLKGIRPTWVPALPRMSASYREFGERFDDFRPPFTRVVREVLAPQVRKNFEMGVGETDNGLGRFPPRAASTLRAMRSRYKNRPILVRSGKWKRNATSFGIWSVTKHDLRLRADKLRPEGRINMMGARLPKGRIPKRNPIAIGPKQMVKIDEIFADHLEETWNASAP